MALANTLKQLYIKLVCLDVWVAIGSYVCASAITCMKTMDIGKATLGVVGGGQLGRMMAWPAHRLGVKLVSLDAAGATSPCAQVTFVRQ